MTEGGRDSEITYETLFELLRREKTNEELQKLDDDFYKKVKNYIAEKSQARLNSMNSNDVFSEIERERLERQLYNTKKLVKEIFERREKKIVNMALNRSRIGEAIIDTSALLKEEKALFESLFGIFDSMRKSVLHNALTSDAGFSSVNKEGEAMLQNTEEEKPKELKTQDIKNHPLALQADVNLNEKTVRMLCDVQQFVGPNLDIYGPFKENEIVHLPEIICSALISTGKAVVIENETTKNNNEVLPLL